MKRALCAAMVALSVAVLPGQARAAAPLNGEGESWPLPVVQSLLIHGTKQLSPFEPEYVDVGEATAKTDVASGSADFAVSSSPLSAADRQAASHAGRSIAYAPYAAGAVAIVVALDVDTSHGGGRIDHITLTVPTIAKLFTHQIVQWNDPEILAENPDQPNLNNLSQPQVFTVPRLDSTSSTAALISLFLSDPTAKQLWDNYAHTLGAPTDTPLDQWPNDPNFQTKSVTSGSKGVLDTILQLNPATGERLPSAASHHIGYVAPAWALKFGAPMATLSSNDGSVKIDPTKDAVSKALADATFDPTTNLVKMKYGITSDGAYPASLVSYLVVPKKGLTSDKARAMSKFLSFAASSAGQADVAGAGYAPVTVAMRSATAKLAAAMLPKTASRPASLSGSSSSSGSTSVEGVAFGEPVASGGLPRTGLPSIPLACAGAVVLIVGDVARRRLLRRSR